MADAQREDSAEAQPLDVLKHITALDGVRGLAIVLVLCYHVLRSNSVTGSRWTDFAVKLFGSGWVGVDLFFALSGFLITGILFDSLGDEHYFRNFYVRRMLRIFPLYYGVVLVLLLIFHAGPGPELKRLLYLATYTQNTALWWHSQAGPRLVVLSGHLWSLSVEEQFYLLWPMLIFAVKDRRRLLWLTAVLSVAALVSRTLLLAHGAPAEATYKLTFCRADSLLGGAALALLMRSPSQALALRASLPVFCASMAGCCAVAWRVGSFGWQDSRIIETVGFSLLALAGSGLIGMALQTESRTARLFRSGWLRFMGKYSYGIYVFHQFVGLWLGEWLSVRLRSHGLPRILQHLVDLVVIVGVTIPLAMLSFRLYERPWLQLKRFFNYQVSKSRALVS